MNKRIGLRIFFFLACAAAFLAGGPRLRAAESAQKTVEVNGQARAYRLYLPAQLPKDRPAPLVLVFHGGGGSAAGAERVTGFSRLADRKGFIAVYPEAVGRSWNDGREPFVSRAHQENIDDVSFVAALLEAVSREHPVDPKRVFAAGISNGAIFSHYLAAHLSSRIAAIAPVVGGMAERLEGKFRPEAPVSVFIIQGTEDPLTPYHGGGILEGRRGRILDTLRAARLWVENNGCVQEPLTGELPNADAADGCRVKWSRWPKGREGTEVLLYTLVGGGHAWPGGPQYLPGSVIGRVCYDFNATAAIWDFFKTHPKP